MRGRSPCSGDPEALADIREADAAYARGDVLRGVEAVSPPGQVSPEGEYELILTPPARRALTERLPEAVAAAVVDFLTGALLQQLRRLGKPRRGDLAGKIWAAPRYLPGALPTP